MIVYFSGTGNSKFTAEEIAKITNEELIAMNELMKEDTIKKLTIKEKSITFVSPTYAWRLPRVVETFIRTTEFYGVDKVYFIMTCGSESGNTIQYVKKLCQEKRWILNGFAEIVLPDNYTILLTSPDEKKAKSLIDTAIPRIREIAVQIQQTSQFVEYENKGLYGKVLSNIVNPMFYSMFIDDKGFHATDKCTACCKCKQLCPLNNIEIERNKPVWRGSCTHCMACINRCPAEAIEYKKKTKGKGRYYIDKLM